LGGQRNENCGVRIIVLSMALSAVRVWQHSLFPGILSKSSKNDGNILNSPYVNQPFEGVFIYSTIPNLVGKRVLFSGELDDDSLRRKTLTYSDESYIRIYNDTSWAGGDQFSFGMDGSAYHGYNLTGSNIILKDSTQTTFADKSLH